MDKIKDLLAKYKVHAALVGGSLVIGSTFGTCTLAPPEAEVAPEAAEPPAPAPEPAEAAPFHPQSSEYT